MELVGSGLVGVRIAGWSELELLARVRWSCCWERDGVAGSNGMAVLPGVMWS